MATELLQNDQAAPIELKNELPPPGRFVQLLVRRPACLICSLWLSSIVFLVLLLAIGELQLSTDETLFVNNEEKSVQHSALLQKLSPTDAEHDIAWAVNRRRLEAQRIAPLPLEATIEDEATARAACPPGQQGDISFTMVYEARDGGNILRPQHLQEVLVVERALLEWAHEAGVCSVDMYCRCRPHNSLVNYIFPSVREAGTTNSTLRFDGVSLATRPSTVV